MLNTVLGVIVILRGIWIIVETIRNIEIIKNTKGTLFGIVPNEYDVVDKKKYCMVIGLQRGSIAAVMIIIGILMSMSTTLSELILLALIPSVSTLITFGVRKRNKIK
ncbi:hypothetical protein [Oceanirhabdus seepicola]|uniref:Uncharacterized protein n=1 Tax=Oceanirhabdus seepicola TaxID=2828781 RepID=A0A9J6P211_9CLOT|nr:hypothetical protein [Oceanirhabdus seepicola]MCM1989925.1 hypothetical protein [Oceanirhabdus seepicola]